MAFSAAKLSSLAEKLKSSMNKMNFSGFFASSSIRAGIWYSWFFFTSISRRPSGANSLAMALTVLDLPVPASPYSSTLLVGLLSSRARVLAMTFSRSRS